MNTIRKTVIATTLAGLTFSASAQNDWKDTANDAWIDGKAETTLILNTNLNNFDIDTDVKDGVVTLSGNVDSQVDKALAGELVSSLDGVSDVNNELKVVTQEKDTDSEMLSKLTDSKVETVVKTRLLMESEVSGMDVNVEVEKGKVTLTGEVGSDAEKDLAGAIAKNTSDVRKVINNLTVES